MKKLARFIPWGFGYGLLFGLMLGAGMGTVLTLVVLSVLFIFFFAAYLLMEKLNKYYLSPEELGKGLEK